jgi:long-chain acyl-CoA synthetase
MEAATSTGTKTIAGLIPRAVAEHGNRVAVRYKHDGDWQDVSYIQLGEIVQEIALGLIELGLQAGERICILANTRAEWTYADMAATSAGAVVVPIYQTNSPEECLWVISDSGACAIVVEDSEQLAKIVEIKDQVPNLRTVIVMEPPAVDSELPLGAISLEAVKALGEGQSAEELDARRAAVRAEDPFTFIYTSGTTGPPKGCVLSHGNYASIIDMVGEAGEITEDEVIYLYLPLAHSFALLVQLAVFDLGGTLLLRRRHEEHQPGAAGGQTDLPALGAACVREDLHARPGRLPGDGARRARTGREGHRPRREGSRHDEPRRSDTRGASEALRGG